MGKMKIDDCKNKILEILSKKKKMIVTNLIYKFSNNSDEQIKKCNSRTIADEILHNFLYSLSSAENYWYYNNANIALKELIENNIVKFSINKNGNVYYWLNKKHDLKTSCHTVAL